MWKLNPDVFFIRWRNKIEPSSLPWKAYHAPYDPCSVAKIPRGFLDTRVNPDTCRIRMDGRGRANSIWTRIRVDVEIFESGKKKLQVQKYPDTCRQGPRRLRLSKNNKKTIEIIRWVWVWSEGIMQIEEGFIRRGRRQRRITPPVIFLIFQIIQKPNPITVSLFIQNHSRYKKKLKQAYFERCLSSRLRLPISRYS